MCSYLRVIGGNLQGQLVFSELLATVFPSGQQPKCVLSQEDRSSAVGRVVVPTVVPEARDEDVTRAGFLECDASRQLLV